MLSKIPKEFCDGILNSPINQSPIGTAVKPSTVLIAPPSKFQTALKLFKKSLRLPLVSQTYSSWSKYNIKHCPASRG
jgi:hypothetical protein